MSQSKPQSPSYGDKSEPRKSKPCRQTVDPSHGGRQWYSLSHRDSPSHEDKQWNCWRHIQAIHYESMFEPRMPTEYKRQLLCKDSHSSTEPEMNTNLGHIELDSHVGKWNPIFKVETNWQCHSDEQMADWVCHDNATTIWYDWGRIWPNIEWLWFREITVASTSRGMIRGMQYWDRMHVNYTQPEMKRDAYGLELKPIKQMERFGNAMKCWMNSCMKEDCLIVQLQNGLGQYYCRAPTYVWWPILQQSIYICEPTLKNQWYLPLNWITFCNSNQVHHRTTKDWRILVTWKNAHTYSWADAWAYASTHATANVWANTWTHPIWY